MGHGADLSKKKPPIEYGKSSPMSDVEFTPETAAHEQSNVCSQCRQNRKATAMVMSWTSRGPKFDTVRYDTTAEIPSDQEIKLPGGAKTLGVAGCTCCDKGEDNNYVCQTYGKLIQAYTDGVKARGCNMNPCKNCDRFWNKGHELGPCTGKFPDYDLDNNGPLVRGRY